MKVKARYFAAVREIVGKSEEDFDLPDGTTVHSLLNILSSKYGEPLRSYIFPRRAGELSPNLNLLLDGKNVAMMDGVETILYEGCVFAIIPPVGGGALMGSSRTRL
ncbi:MoaD family protein [Candidatus Bathyarchaeota archaeon]|nr:MoaD family protein [Candidatus Bathyarchaeota archaeon]